MNYSNVRPKYHTLFWFVEASSSSQQTVFYAANKLKYQQILFLLFLTLYISEYTAYLISEDPY